MASRLRRSLHRSEKEWRGKALAGLNAQTKGRSLGIFKPHEEKAKKARDQERDKTFRIELCGRPVPAKNTDDGIRAVKGAQVIEPDSVRRYLDDKFGEDLKTVRSAMQKLAKAYKPSELAHDAYRLYERFRPGIPAGKKGWGCQGRPGPGPDREACEEEALIASCPLGSLVVEFGKN